MRVLESVLLPDPLGPMTVCTSPRLKPSETPRRISRPSTETCRSLISKSANVFPLSVGDVVGAARIAVAEPARPDDRRPEQPPVQVLLLPAGIPAAGGDVLDGTVAVSELESAVGCLEQFGHVTVFAREPDQFADTLREVQARQVRPILGLEPPGAGGEEALQLLPVQELDQLSSELAVAAGEVVAGGRRQPVDVARPARSTVPVRRHLDQAPGLQRLQVPERALL